MTTTPSAPLSAAELDEIEVGHFPDEFAALEGTWCICGNRWPCEIRTVISLARDALALAALREAAARIRELEPARARMAASVIGPLPDADYAAWWQAMDALLDAALAAGRATAGTT